MAIAANSPVESPPPKRKWSRKDLGFLIDSGVFAPDERLELIEGDLVETVPQKSPHATGVRACEEAMRAAFTTGYDVRTQLPLAISEYNEPNPDVAVVHGSFRDYEDDHPSTAALVVEVADTSLSYDRATKAGLYARAGVQEYWILNLSDRLLEIHRQPAAISAEPGGHHYLSIERYTEGQTVAPLLAPESTIQVAALLPRRKEPEEA